MIVYQAVDEHGSAGGAPRSAPPAPDPVRRGLRAVWRRVSFRTRLFVAVLGPVVVALALCGFALERAADSVLRDDLRATMRGRASEILATLERYLAERRGAVEGWASAQEMESTLENADPKFAEDYLLRRFSVQPGAFSFAAVLDAEGRVAAAVAGAHEAASVTEKLRGQPLGVAAGLEAAKALDGVVAVGTDGPAEAGEGERVWIAAPVKDFAGDLVGTVVAALGRPGMERLLEGMTEDAGGHLPIAYRAAGGLSFGPPGRDVRTPLALVTASAARAGAGDLLGIEHGGAQLAVTSARDQGTAAGWRVALVVSEAKALGSLHRVRSLVALVIAAVLVLISVVAFSLGTVLVEPVRRLTAVARDIAAGELGRAEQALGGAAALAKSVASQERTKDELQLLAGSFARMLAALRSTSLTMQESSGTLAQAVSGLNELAARQTESVREHTLGVQDTQATAQEIRQTSELASRRTASVLMVAERAELVSQSGESAVAHTIRQLGEIRAEVQAISGEIAKLRVRTKQIGEITQTVEEFAAQSNLLALNAAIEAMRSGSEGRGFGVVAREIRTLADQSREATMRVREILADIVGAVDATAAMTQAGTHKIESGLEQVRASGESLRELSGIVKGNTAAVRQIAEAVNQQHAGFDRIFEALQDLGRLMGESERSLAASAAASATVTHVSRRIDEAARRYRV